jgi:hypothetical protein
MGAFESGLGCGGTGVSNRDTNAIGMEAWVAFPTQLDAVNVTKWFHAIVV